MYICLIKCFIVFVLNQEQHESSTSKFNKISSSTTAATTTTAASTIDADLTDDFTRTLTMQSNSNGGNETNDENSLENDVEMSIKKRSYALRELVHTEETYVIDLALIVDGYIREIRDPDSDIPKPDDLKGGKERMVFGNVEAIYEWHRE